MVRSRGWDVSRSLEIARRAMSATTHDNLASALVAALRELMVVDAVRVADAGSYKYKYADIADAVKLTRPTLAAHGVVALTPVHEHGDQLACTVILLHTSGDKLELGPFPFPHGKDAQATGSMVTYHRRYALIAALGMAAGADDDDGAGAAPREPAARKGSRQGPPSCVLCGNPLTDGPAKPHEGGYAHTECITNATGGNESAGRPVSPTQRADEQEPANAPTGAESDTKQAVDA